ncbi:MAG TPA: M56 family metallopeptidase, partial [Fimbriimonadaceae bacterium]|nr:M56 family metallopeptidase [Fimbriimonadaceae bacterium]
PDGPSRSDPDCRILLAVWVAGATVLAIRDQRALAQLRRWRGRSVPAPEPLQLLASQLAPIEGRNHTFRLRTGAGSPSASRPDLIFLGRKIGARARRMECVSRPRRLRGMLDFGWELRMSRESSPPVAMTWGLRRPIILLPRGAESWSEQRLRVVLLHEFGHVGGRDHLWRRLAAVASAVYWFHPIVWFAARQLRFAMEQSADDRVVAWGIAAPDYAQELVTIAASLRSPCRAPAAAIVGGSPLGARIRLILDPSSRRSPARLWQVLLAGLIGSAALALVPVCRPAGVSLAGQAEPSRLLSASRVQDVGWPGEHFPATRLRVLGQNQIDSLNYAQARYAVNEAFARHGVSFRKKPIRDQFLKMTWYTPVPGRYEEASRPLLTPIEGPNVDRLETRLSYLRSAGREMR